MNSILPNSTPHEMLFLVGKHKKKKGMIRIHSHMNHSSFNLDNQISLLCQQLKTPKVETFFPFQSWWLFWSSNEHLLCFKKMWVPWILICMVELGLLHFNFLPLWIHLLFSLLFCRSFIVELLLNYDYCSLKFAYIIKYLNYDSIGILLWKYIFELCSLLLVKGG
jgi:hypothetical protein